MSDDPSDLARLRLEYESAGTDRDDLNPDPLIAFATWLDEARAAGCAEPNAMVVSVVDPDGWPSARNMLLKGIDNCTFTFFTNYESDKARALDTTGKAALTFSWLELHRQVRIVGPCTRTSEAASNEYFEVRPRGSQLGAWASDQSRPLADRGELETRFADLETEWDNRPVTRPAHWGGYQVDPQRIEFWQG
ncbi:MAG: pyridoxamine 5'-phosphate oxidase, partial [Acidimicrobiales bacterium]